MFDFAKTAVAETAPTCTGLRFRFRRQTYMSGGMITNKETTSLLKRTSCNCDVCHGLLEHLQMDMEECYRFDMGEFEDGATCGLVVVSTDVDSITGTVEGIELAFTLIEEGM